MPSSEASTIENDRYNKVNIHFFNEGGIGVRKRSSFVTCKRRSRMKEVESEVCVITLHRLTNVLFTHHSHVT